MNVLSPWAWLRARVRPARRPAIRRPRLLVETLEDRLALSSTPGSTTLASWRSETFTVDDAVRPPSQIASLGVTTQAENASFGSLIGLNTTLANSPYKGDGYSVAVLDTGINYNLPDLGGGWGKKVIAGYDFVNNDSNPMDDNGHGTFVASEIASSSATYSGVAPDVNLIALKVMDANGTGTFGNIADALTWVINNQAKYNIVAVSMSLGSGNYTVNPYTFLESSFSTLVSDGVFISVAAGNDYFADGSTPGLAFPAISSNVVSVGAVWTGNFGQVGWGNGAMDYTTAADQIASFSQRSSALDILAPGALLTGDALNGGTTTMAGTSMAAPIVAAAAVLIHQALDARGMSATESRILQIMQSTGVSITDTGHGQDNVSHTGLTFKRLDIYAALNSLGTIYVPPTLGAIANKSFGVGHTLVVSLPVQVGSLSLTTLTAQLHSLGALAYTLKTSLGLTYSGNYYTNQYGANEKWLQSTGGVWVVIMPDGTLRRWGGTMAATLLPANLIATLSPAYYNDPSLLWNAAPAPSLPVTLSLVGTQLSISAASSYTGTFQIDITASDGKQTLTQSFQVTVLTNTAPKIATINPVTIPENGSTIVTLAANDAETDPVSYTVSVVGGSLAVVSIKGNQLTVQTLYNYTGSFDIQVSASDGLLHTSTTFHVTVPPTQHFTGAFGYQGATGSAEFRSDGSWWVTINGVTTEWSQWVPASSWAKIMTGDFNGDGRLDVVGLNKDGSWWVGLSTGSGFVTSQWSQWVPASSWADIYTGNFNGDNKTDIVGFNNDGGWWVGLSTGSSFATSLWSQWSPAVSWDVIQVSDFNNDGKSDVVGFNNDGTWWVGLSAGSRFTTSAWSTWMPAISWATIQFGDFNGDGKTDIIGFSNAGGWWVGLSTGTSFRTSLWAQWTPIANWTSIGVGDINGDGLIDIYGTASDGTPWQGLSTGSYFGTSRMTQALRRG